jgi:hypothetical protein
MQINPYNLTPGIITGQKSKKTIKNQNHHPKKINLKFSKFPKNLKVKTFLGAGNIEFTDLVAHNPNTVLDAMVKIKSASILCNVHVFPSAPSPAPTPST